MPSAAFLIYSGIMPLIKTFISIIVGYILARKGLFPPEASRGASQVTMNISLPALIFSNIVPAFTPSNISALGPLFLTAFSYQAIGFIFGLIIRELFYVPRNFWQGIVIVTGMSNWGNLPNAVVMSVTQQAPFNPATDPALGVSFVSIFIVTYHLVFWVGGAAHSLSWDYLPGIPQGGEAESHVSWKEKPIGSFIARRILHLDVPASNSSADSTKHDTESCHEQGKEKMADVEKGSPQLTEPTLECVGPHELDPDVQLARRTSRLSTAPSYRRPSISQAGAPVNLPPAPPPSPAPTSTHAPSVHALPVPKRILRTLRPLSAIVTPITITLAISLPVALVNDLKALFVNVASQGGPDWAGPDNRPPLAFVMDTASFLGSIAIPLALILLGASFARLRIPRPLSRLPIAAMLAVSCAKMLFLPIIGVFMIQGMVHGGLIPADALAERFVPMFLSGTPAAVNQLIVSSLYAPEGEVDTLAAFLLVQYVFMFFSSAALTAVALLLI
ncbi:auxin efflux carrier [Amylocystis lapponica]|nr:auxin efflux carrier [Amylocystis lapponica]